MRFRGRFCSIVSTLLGAALLGFAAAGCSRPADADAAGGAPRVLRVADTGIEGMEALASTFGPFARELEKLAGVKVEFFPVSDRTAAITALQFGQLDLVLAGPSEYIIMRSRLRLAPQPVVGLERPRYHTAFVVKADSPVRTLADLRGKSIAMKDPGSTTGHIIPYVMLKQAGMDPDRDVTVRLLDGARLEALINGDVDALASGVRDFDKLVERFGPDRFRIIAESAPVPADLFVARGDLSPEFVAKLSGLMLEHADTLLPLLLSGGNADRYESGVKLAPVVDSDYAVIREGYALLKLPLE